MTEFFLIAYDLRNPGQNYSVLYDEIKKLGDWQHPLESVWVVKVDGDTTNADTIYDRIRPRIDDADYLFIVKVKDDYIGWLPKNFWTWFKQNQ